LSIPGSFPFRISYGRRHASVVNDLEDHRDVGLLYRQIDQDKSLKEVETKGLKAALVSQFPIQEGTDDIIL